MKARLLKAAVLGGWLLATGSTSAEVVERGSDGFALRFSAVVDAPSRPVVEAIGDLPHWWDPAHTYSGDQANLSLVLEPGGCWCEALPDGRVFRHAEVVSVDPDGRVDMRAPLGPLYETARRADLTWSWTPHAESQTISADFVVEGPGLGAAADAVDGVMGMQFGRLIQFIQNESKP